ncbi:MAG: hypothetical protein RJQ08_02165 [Salinisphaeraceae bacterium]
MKRMILSLALAAGAITQVNAQTLPDVGGLPGTGSGADPGLLLDLLNGGFDQFAGEDGMLPAGEGVGQLTGLGEQVRTLLVDPLNEALPDPLLLPLLSDLSIVLSDLNTGGTPSLPGLPGGDDEGELPELPGADELPDALEDLIPDSGGLEPPMELAELLDVMALQSALEDLIGEAGGAEQLMMLLDTLSEGDLGDPSALGDLLDPAGLQGMLEDLIPESGGLEPPDELAGLLDAMALQSALEDLVGEAGGADQLTMVLDGLADVAQP